MNEDQDLIQLIDERIKAYFSTGDAIKQISLPNIKTATDRTIHEKHIQMLDARHIQVGRSSGTMIGTAADQKLGFFGATPVVQAAAPTTLANVITVLKNLGLTQ